MRDSTTFKDLDSRVESLESKTKNPKNLADFRDKNAKNNAESRIAESTKKSTNATKNTESKIPESKIIESSESTDSAILLRAHNLTHKFDNVLYKNVNLTIKAAESVAIVGVSGSGKSTLLNNLSTMLPPTSGIVELNGKRDIYALKSEQLLSMRRNDIGIIFQSHYLFRGFSTLENLQVASILTNKPIDMEMLESFGVASLLKQPISELSGGQQQRLSIARVLTKKPKIIFADEPTGNLDRDTTLKVMEVVFGYIKSHNAAMMVVTHDMEIAKMCDRIFVLKEQNLLEI